MQNQKLNPLFSFFLILAFISLACSSIAAEPTAVPNTDTPAPTATDTAIPTNTPRPSPTPRPTKTPDLAATQKYEGFNAEAQKYFDLGYLSSTDGKFKEFDDFTEDWAQLGWYRRWELYEEPSDFYMSAHFKWSSAYRNADISGCGFAFAIQENGDHYAVFLDRSKVYFVETEYYYSPIGPTRGTGRVKFENPFDKPAEADFTILVKGNSAYVLVDDELVGEYTLSQSMVLRGKLGFTLLSGTNKDYGTRCEMTDIHLFIPD
jgi:hypothetical protein